MSNRQFGPSYAAHPVYSSRRTPIVTGTTTPSRLITENVLSRVEDYESATLERSSANIENLTPVASYNWLEATKPTIAVPGSPPIWKSKALPYAVKRDSGWQFIDQNGFRSPQCPLTPLVASIQYWNPTFDLSKVDIVTDRNNLRKLLRWIEGKEDQKDFRIDVDLAGKGTILFTRWEPRTRDSDSFGYGHEFEKATTTSAKGLEGSTGHHRIISYDFAGLKLLVRFEVDACLPTAPSIDDLVAKTSALSVKDNKDKDKVIPPHKIEIIPTTGDIVPQSSLIELKTRSVQSAATFDWSDTYPQLYLSKTPHMYLAVHQRGTFSDVQVKALDDPDMVQRSKASARSLKKLGSLLKMLRHRVLDETGLFERVYHRLPDELLHAFN